jgi:gliding motility-associated-like protein
VFLVAFLFFQKTYGQLYTYTTMTPVQLVQNVLVGTGVTVTNVQFTGLAGSIGNFTTGPVPTNLGLSSGVVMSTGLVNGSVAIGSAVGNFASNSNGTGSDPNLQSLIPTYTINDACVLQFDFTPLSDTIRFRYVFGSEEYNEWVGSSFNDVFGFFVSGPNPMGGNYTNKNIALLPGTTLPVTIDNVNSGMNSVYYINNEAIGGTSIVFDGFTVVLTAWCLVVPCIQYHIKLAIGDAGDSAYDSAVFLEENSFSSNAVSISTYYSTPQAGSNAIEGCSDAIISFKLPVPAPNPFVVSYSIMGTATNGTDYTTITNSVTIPTGQDSVNLVIHPLLDGLTEGTESVTLVVQTSVCGGTDTVSIDIIDNIAMSLSASNDTTICGGSASIWASATGGITPYTYQWNNGIGNVPSATVSPTVTTTYQVTVSDLCGTTITESITVYIGQGNASAGNDVTLCEGESTTLTCIGGTGYLWSNGASTPSIVVTPTTTTTYYVTAYGTCNAYDTVTVFINPLPVITASSSSGSISLGSSVTLSTSGGITYQWSSNPSDPTLATQSTSSSPTVTPQTTTTYNVVGWDANGCTGSASVTVIVIPVFPIVDFDGAPLSGCEPLLVQFYDHSSQIGVNATYFWDFGNGTTSTDVNPQAYYADHGIYDVSLTITNPGGYGSTLLASGYVEVYPSPIAIFEVVPNSQVTIIQSTVGFFDRSIGYPDKWSWSFGDGDTSDQSQVYHNYEDTGTYNVSLIVTTEHGCADTATTNVVVRPETYLFVPSAFTPNNNGTNDMFFVKGEGILDGSFTIRIFNRWGEEVFFSTDINQSWDGTHDGKKVPGGTYVYLIDFLDINYEVRHMKGYITVYR